ncbi:MAG: hypothetical protein ACREFS_14925 [Acetobacteraceae bacterium]
MYEALERGVPHPNALRLALERRREERGEAPPAAPSLWATAVTISTLWTPEQALVMFELLDALRDRIWSLYGRQIQALLRDQQRGDAAGAHRQTHNRGDRSF